MKYNIKTTQSINSKLHDSTVYHIATQHNIVSTSATYLGINVSSPSPAALNVQRTVTTTSAHPARTAQYSKYSMVRRRVGYDRVGQDSTTQCSAVW
jgi:hypothetical protein